jgi:hypothetical protein
VIGKKHLGLAALCEVAEIAGRLLLRGQTNFVRSLWKFSRVYSADRQYGDHARPITYAMRPPSVRWRGPRRAASSSTARGRRSILTGMCYM